MSSTTTTSHSTSSNFHSERRPSRIRRFSQRTYAQLHLFSSGSNNNNNNNNNNSTNSVNTGRRNSGFSHRLSWLAPSSSSTSHPHSPPRASADFSSPINPRPLATSAPCPESEQPPLSRYISAPSGISGNYQSAGGPDPSSQASIMSNPINERRSSGMFARLRGAPAQNRLSRTFDTTPVNTAGERNPSEMRTSPDYTSIDPGVAEPQASMPTLETLPSGPTSEGQPQPHTVAGEGYRTTQAAPNRKATIRFFPYNDQSQSSKPSLPFIPVTRVLPADRCAIRVGRYSERDGVSVPNPSEPSDSPIGFKSKVVSRKHCEFLYLSGQWHIKDVGSSSGTFLNHMRLSQPNLVSRLYTIKDGDIVQLGIDFRGGNEMIFRCVRIRVECNRSWQQQPNEFKYVSILSFFRDLLLTGG